LKEVASTRYLYLVPLLAILPVLSACSITTTIKHERPEVYAFIHPTDTEHWQQAAWGLEAAANDHNVAVEILEVDIREDYDNSIDLIKKAVRKSTRAIILTPFESKELHKLLEKARNKDIELVYLDAAEPYDIPGTYIYSDNEAAAEKAGHLLAKSLGNKGKVVMLNIASDNPKSLAREKGFRKAIDQYLDMELVNIFDCNSSRANVSKTMEDILKAHPDVQGVFAACPETSAGLVSSLISLGKADDIKIVGFDHTAEILNYISTGRISAYVGQNSYQLGYKAMKTALDILTGQSVPEKVDVGYDIFEAEESVDLLDLQDIHIEPDVTENTEEVEPQG
jgi:ribose transport system substrate-binding protein